MPTIGSKEIIEVTLPLDGTEVEVVVSAGTYLIEHASDAAYKIRQADVTTDPDVPAGSAMPQYSQRSNSTFINETESTKRWFSQRAGATEDSIVYIESVPRGDVY